MMKQKILFLVACFCMLLAAPSILLAQGKADWAGEWDSRWRGGGARLYLEQSGDQVTGTYPLYNGRIVATARGRQLEGRWMEGERSGQFLFVQSDDGKDFTGRFETGEWWTGYRTMSLTEADRLLDQSTPQATMRSFLNIMNSMNVDSVDMIGLAARALRIGEGSGEQINIVNQTELFYRVMDRLTFRIWSLPEGRDPAETRVTSELSQSGTGVRVIVNFEKHGDDWFIVPAAAAELERQLKALDAARPPAKPNALGPASPRDAFRDFIVGYVSSHPPERAAALKALDLSGISALSQSSEVYILAGYLKRVLDRVGFIIWQEIPDDPNFPETFVHFEHGSGQVEVSRTDAEGGTIWRFSPDTVAKVRDLYSAVQDMPVDNFIRNIDEKEAYFQIRNAVEERAPFLLRPFGILETWQWLGLVGAVGAAWGVGRGVSKIRLRGPRKERLSGGWLNDFVRDKAAALLLAGATLILVQRVFGLPDIIGSFTTTAGWVLATLTGTLVFFRLINMIADRYRSSTDLSGQARTLISLFAGLLRIAVAIGAILLLADIMDLPYQGVLAGLGIGGLAVALAAQSTLQNFIAGITLYVDRPISVGDFCRFGDKLGTVEYIGFRSTRIRTLDRTLIIIPNSEFSNMTLENYAHRDRIWLQTVLQLRYETTPDQLRYVIAELRKLLIAHPKVAPDPSRVRFIGFGEYSLNVEIYAYVLTSDYQEYLAILEDINLRIMTLIEQAGAQFAFPSAIEYQATDQTIDPALVKSAELAVAKWRSDGKLPFPDYDWRDKSDMSGTLEYPPDGSILAEQMRTPFAAVQDEAPGKTQPEPGLAATPARP
jgi:MscS family membrane protein